MAYNALNNLIDAYIYPNGVQAITGSILNNVLKTMVSQLGGGYNLMGVAAPASSPAVNDEPLAYFAATAGTYTNFDGIVLAAGEVAVLLTSGNGSWSKQTIYVVPTDTADLTNTAGFITSAVNSLVNYYTKTEIDTALAGYTTTAALATALADYYNKSAVDAQMATRYTKSEVDTKLGDYYRKAETYDKDEVDSIVAALSRQEYIVAWDGSSAPVVADIPAGVTVTYSGNTYTGTLAASASTVNKIYMVWNGVAYDMYGTSQDGGYSWVPMGTTSVDLSQYATKAEFSQLWQEINGELAEYNIVNGSQGNPANAWVVTLKGTDTLAIAVQPSHKYKLVINKTSAAGYNYYMRIVTYNTNNPSSLLSEPQMVRNQTLSWNNYFMNGDIFETNDSEYGMSIQLTELTAPGADQAVGTCIALRATDFEPEDIEIVDLDESIKEKCENAYDNSILNSIVAAPHLNGTKYNLSHDIINHKITINANGVRVYLFGKTIGLVGPFEIDYGTSGNGRWVLSRDAVFNAAHNSDITLTSAIVKYYTPAERTSDIVLFSTYFGVIGYDGILGAALLELDLRKENNLGRIDVVNMLGGEKENIVVDRDGKTVTIKKEGCRIIVGGAYYSLSGNADFVMSYDSAQHSNGGWFLRKNSILGATGGSIALSSDNIYYAQVTGETFSQDILLFPTYYGDIAPVGILGPYLTDGIKPIVLRDNGFFSAYNETDTTAKSKEYSALLNNTAEVETLVFMTDPHLLGDHNTFDETTFKTYISLLQKYYNSSPTDLMVCGGDWLNEGDTQDSACWKLGYVDATMRKLFKHYYPILGNHDTNYQGVVSSDDSSRGDLAHQTLVNLMFRENGNTYYKFTGNKTQFYVFDTGTDWETSMDAFKWEQIDWFANALMADDAKHCVILQHMYYYWETNVNPMASNIQAVAGAYNSRASVTLNGITYNFAGCTGKIACVIAGHSHTDALITNGVSVPVWLTTNMRDGNTPTFDLLLIDYGANVLKGVRVGTGNSRTMTLA